MSESIECQKGGAMKRPDATDEQAHRTLRVAWNYQANKWVTQGTMILRQAQNSKTAD